MDNRLKHALGNAPNSEFLIDPTGKVLVKRMWSDPKALRKDLERIIGKVEKPTTIADLKLKTQPPPKVAARGVVPRLSLPGNLRALKIEPVSSTNGEPYYVKLRAEGDSNLRNGQKGKLYLGFHLDPIYKVHWNNLTKPIRVTLQPPNGMKASKTTLTGPKVKQESDIDPREFLVELEGVGKKPLRISVSYFACNDDEGWCKAVKQEYLVHFQIDPDAGWAMKRRGNRGGRGRPNFNPRDLQRGRIISVNVKDKTVTVMTRDRKQQTYSVADDARFRRGPQSAKLADFQRGDFVMMRLEKSKDGKQVVRGMMSRGPGFPGRRP